MKGGARPNSGPKKGSKNKQTIEKLRAEEVLKEQLKPHAEKVAEALAVKAESGDIGAIKEFNDRLYGKVKETVEHIGEVQIDVDIKKVIDKVYGDIN